MAASARFRVAPGVSIRASGRGIRTSVGPRAARVHVGAGRTAVSSGVGPFTVSRTSRGGRRSSNGRSSRSGGMDFDAAVGVMSAAVWVTGAVVRHRTAQAEAEEQRRRAEEYRSRVVAAERVLTSLHLEDFPVATRRVVEIPEPGRWQRLRGPDRRVLAQIETEQAIIDAQWNALECHDPETVIREVDQAFADNASPSACIDAGQDGTGTKYVTLVVSFPGPEIAGIPIKDLRSGEVRQRTSREYIDLYNTAVASAAVATAKEALATAPAATEARVVVLRTDKQRLRRSTKLGVIYAGTFGRAILTVDWNDTSPFDVIAAAADALFNSPRLKPLQLCSLDGRQDLREIVERIESAAAEQD